VRRSSSLRSIFIALAILGGLLASASAQDLWQGQSIYQIVTDRFFNGDVSNDNADGNYNPSAGQGVHGGDFKGVEQKLDYIKALGETAIWISPVVKNANGDYHGYAGSDFYNVDPHWGTLADLQHLIQTAHSKGLLVVDDVVVNHGSQLLTSNDSGYPNFKAPPDGYNLFYRDNSKQYASPFDPGSGQSLTALFHNNGFIQDFNNSTQVELGSLEGLDDFRTESGYIQTNMANIYKFWLEQGFDGFRVDTVKHVDQGFWQNWCPQIHADAASHGSPNFFMFGEVYDQSETKNASYTGTISGPNFELDSVLDYPLYFAIGPVFALANSNTKQIEDHYNAVDADYDPSAKMRLVTFLDNHDQPRFLNSANANNDMARLNLALTFLYTARGIPCLYYGTEQAFNGGADPNNREDMFAGQFEHGPSLGDNFNETHPLFQLIAKLNNLRRLYPALRSGSHVNLWNDQNGPGLFAYSRVFGSQEIFAVLNTAAVAQTLPSRPSTYAAGTLLVNLLDPGEAIAITPDGQTPSISVPGTTAKLFIAQSQALPLDPVVTSITPAHDAHSVPTASNIVIQFSKAMDMASVEAAFSTFPATTGTFSWSPGNDRLTYQITGGLPQLTTMSVHLASNAIASDGTSFYAPFDSRFTTTQASATDAEPPVVTITSPHDGDLYDNNHPLQGTATDNVGVVELEEQIDGGDWISTGDFGSQKTVSISALFSTGYTVNGPHTISIRASDAAGNVSAIASVNVRFINLPQPYDKRVIANDYSSTNACDGTNTWTAAGPYSVAQAYKYWYAFSFGYDGGNHYVSSNSIANACANEQYLYQNERYSSPATPFRYLFHCPPGQYQVTLAEAETFFSGPNQRQFDVYIQGEKVLRNVDIYAAAGGPNLAVTFTVNTQVANDLLEVSFLPVLDNARISGIHVLKTGETFSDTDGIPDWWRLAYFSHATGLAADGSRASDDPDGDGRTNLQEYLAGTDPTNVTSVLRITNTQRSGNDVVLTFIGSENKYYQVQQTSSLTSPNWTDVGSTFPGIGGTQNAYVRGAATLPAPQFFRISVVQ
jgi:glycosidase